MTDDKTVCWACYLQHCNNHITANLLWENGCEYRQSHKWNSGGKYTRVYRHESGLLLRPLPKNVVNFSSNFVRCQHGDNCHSGLWCTFAHSKLELKVWNAQKQDILDHNRLPPSPPIPKHQPQPPIFARSISTFSSKGGGLSKLKHKHDYELLPKDRLDLGLMTQPLTRENYVDKFHTLLYYEEHEHARVLKERCDGKLLRLSLFEQNDNCAYGSLTGLQSSDIAYVQQAATHVEITLGQITASAEIIDYSVSHKGLDVIKIQFDNVEKFYELKPIIRKEHKCDFVHFILKHSYFRNLHRSLDRATSRMIERLIPETSDLDDEQRNFQSIRMPGSECLLLDKEYQLLALKKLMVCDSSVPFLVTGPFGTGKTRLLATAAVNFLRDRDRNNINRVLICTSHLQSADAYIDNYFGPMLEDKSISFSVKRLTARQYKIRSDYQHLFTDGFGDAEIKNCHLVITTFLTAPNLIKMKVRPFTHILIDEGAQTREPETIAPLGLADDHTKIVIAGDHLQIGPQMLVLGKEVRKHGLGTSLLKRLHGLYNNILDASEDNPYTAQLLTNYRCHDSILRLPSNLFFDSTLHVRTNSKLHPKMSSALVFVCTSMDSTVTTSSQDFSRQEATTTLEQVQCYVDSWPTVEWGDKDLSTICVMASNRSQIRSIRRLLNTDRDFRTIKGIETLTTYELQGREFRAVFISTVEITNPDDGSTYDPTKSICDQYVFNTIITRAKSLVVCVGNPFLLFSIEKSTPGYSIHCWREYIKRCLETSSLKLTPQCYEKDESIVKANINHLYSEILGDLQDSVAPSSGEVQDASDSILEAYKSAFLSSKACQKARVALRNIEHGDRGYKLLKNDEEYESSDEAPEDAPVDDTPIECYLESTTFRKCTATPLDPKEPNITVQGVNNRRCALDGARVKVHMYKDSERFGRVCEVVEQGPQQQFVCRVDNYNAIFFYPIDRKNPKLVNLPGLSREILKRASESFIIEEELKYKHRAVTVFDPKSFSIHDNKIDIPKIKDVIPLNIAQKLLFVVWYLRWMPKYRFPLGVVIAAIPKGLTLYHGERLLLAHHHINTDEPDDGDVVAVPAALPHYDHAFTIDPPEAQAFDDALTLDPVACDDSECYQLGIHITNVGGAVRKGSKVDVGAQERVTAVYGSKLCPKYYPLLSEEVREKLSLNCGVENSAISYTCRIRIVGNDVKIVQNTVDIHESFVRSRARLTYEEVQHSLAEVQDGSLNEKVTSYNKRLPTDNTFKLKQRLATLLKVSESFFRKRIQFDDVDYSIEDADNLLCPQAYFLVSELMIWANRIAAEHILSNFPQLALLRRQKPPNQERLVKALEKYEDRVAHSPVHKALADTVNITTEPGSIVIMKVVRSKVYDALQHGDLMQAKNLLRITNYHPQLAVLCKEVNGTKSRAEYVCTSMLQQKKPLALDGKYLVSLPQDVSEVYGHNDLCCLYTHSTSPLRRYADIVVQRLILQSLSSSSMSTCTKYSEKELTKISKNCNTKTSNANKFQTEYNRLSIALSLTKCSQSCTVYVTSVEKLLNFVIRELDYHCLSMDQRSFRLSSITSNVKPWAATLQKVTGGDDGQPKGSKISQKDDGQLQGSKAYVWKAMVTSFSGKLVVDKSLVNATICKPTSELARDAMLTFYVDNTEYRSVTAPDVEGKALVQHCYMAEFASNATTLDVEDWKKVSDFMKLPTQDTASPLKNLLGSCHPSYQENSNFPPNASFWLYETRRSFKIYEVFKVYLTASYRDHILSPCIQLLEIAPMLNVCVQHSTKPADCFSSPILSHASKVKYNDIHEYIELWESVLLAEAAVQSVGEAETQLIQNVPLEWPKLRQPGSSLDDVYYSPFKEGTAKEELADITLTIPAKFDERCGEYFDLQVGNLVCARYNILLGEEKEVDGRKVTTASAVYHFIIHEIKDPDSDDDNKTHTTTKKRFKKQNAKKQSRLEKKDSKNLKVIHMKFASKDTARVSPFMKRYLKDSTCEIQVIPLDLPYRRMYRSLRTVRYTENTLCQNIAVGEATIKNKIKNHDSFTRNTLIKRDPLVVKLWTDEQRQSMNEEQTESVKIAVESKFQLIQGPPGTGKSVTGAHLAYALIISDPNSTRIPCPNEKIRCVMYCGPSNKSVDVVLSMFLKHPGIKDLRVLRIYSKSIETKYYYGPHSNKVLNKPSSEQGCSEAHEPYALHNKIRSEECEHHKEILHMEKKFERYAKENKLSSPFERKRFNDVIKEAEGKVIRQGNYQIVFCTCNEASSVRVVKNIEPTHLIIDEAAMATEPEAMIPIQLANHVTLIGDHMQLQPVINHTPAKEKGLGRSLFQRYAEGLEKQGTVGLCKEDSLKMLRTQYRMHRAICEFPSDEFYDNKLITDPSVLKKFCSLEGFWPKGPNFPIAFCDVEGKEEEGSSYEKVHQDSKSNKSEAEKIVQIITALKKVKRSIPKRPEIAVLTPYKAQKKFVEDLVKEEKNVTVRTIDESQGSEFDFVIFSTVRSMPHRIIKNKAAVQADRAWIREHLGFITDRHQICVGITRAKHGLVIVGNATLLQYDKTWKALLAHYEERGCLVDESSFPYQH